MKESTSYDVIADYLPPGLRSAFLSISRSERERISELRLNCGRPAALVYPDKIGYLTQNGMTTDPRNTSVVKVYPEYIDHVVDAISHYSLHSCSRQLSEGVFVLGRGIRVGLSGTYGADGIMTDVTGLNFRISRNIVGCADMIYSLINERCRGILICGGVNSGKTTLLRDLCRSVGSKWKVTLVDERNDIAASNGRVIENDVGILTNVLTGCTRAKGIVSAVRTLSPDYIFCDEIASENDISAILGSIGCGVRFCATAHGNSIDDLRARTGLGKLLDTGVFSHVIILKGAEYPGKIKEIRRLGDDI